MSTLVAGFFVINFYYVNFDSRVNIILLVFLLLLFIFLNLIKRFEILDKSKSFKSFESFRIVTVMVFYCFLSLDFLYSNMRKSTFLKTVLIDFSYVKTRL